MKQLVLNLRKNGYKKHNMDVRTLLVGLVSFLGAHILTFFQLNGQFLKTDWFRKNEFWVAAIGICISYLYIWGTRYTVEGMGGLLWPARFIGFGIGIMIYALGVNYFFSEGINSKTIVSLLLALSLIVIQVVWKTS
jgi:hypothetical protein